MTKQPLAILDRDGTIIEDVDYIREPEKVAWVKNASAGLRLMQQKGYGIFVVSNQSGVGRGLIKPDELNAVHKVFVELLAADGIVLAGHGYCFHRPDENCGCRKPNTGLIPPGIDLGRSFVVG